MGFSKIELIDTYKEGNMAFDLETNLRYGDEYQRLK